jgi:polyisoprenoid-binding protein YceI
MRAPARAVLLLGMMALVSAAIATPPPLPSTTPAPLFAPGRYAVDSAATKVHFHAKALVGGYEGDFVAPQGSVVIDPARPDRAQVDISFPVERLTTGDGSTDAMLKGDSFFAVAKFPIVRFTAQDAPLGRGDRDIPIPGMLTMHGQTRPVTLTVRLVGVTPDEAPGLSVLHFTGTMAIERSQYGMGFGRPFVSDTVSLTIDALFRRA